MTAKIDWYREVLALEPNSKVFFPLARLLADEGDAQEAVRILEHGLDRHPEYLEARLCLIEILYKNVMTEKCEAEIEKLNKVFASYAGFWHAWAACLASDKAQADTASLLRFLAAHFVSGKLQLHEVLNRGLDAIMRESKPEGQPEAPAVPAIQPGAQEAGSAPEMVEAAGVQNFVDNQQAMLDDLDAELEAPAPEMAGESEIGETAPETEAAEETEPMAEATPMPATEEELPAAEETGPVEEALPEIEAAAAQPVEEALPEAEAEADLPAPEENSMAAVMESETPAEAEIGEAPEAAEKSLSELEDELLPEPEAETPENAVMAEEALPEPEAELLPEPAVEASPETEIADEAALEMNAGPAGDMPEVAKENPAEAMQPEAETQAMADADFDAIAAEAAEEALPETGEAEADMPPAMEAAPVEAYMTAAETEALLQEEAGEPLAETEEIVANAEAAPEEALPEPENEDEILPVVEESEPAVEMAAKQQPGPEIEDDIQAAAARAEAELMEGFDLPSMAEEKPNSEAQAVQESADKPARESGEETAEEPLLEEYVEEEPFSLRTRSMAEVLAEQGDLKGALDIYQELAAAATSSDELNDINQRVATLQSRLNMANASTGFKAADAEAQARSKEKLIGMLEALAQRVEARAQN